MRNIKRLFALSMAGLTLTVGSHASAAEWVSLGKASFGLEFFYDISSKKTTRQGTKQIWIKSTGGTDSVAGKLITSQLYLKEFKCLNSSSRIIQLITYYEDDSNDTAKPTDSAFNYVAPDTIEESIMRKVCR